jgi:AcrR family transcriptional regulator
MPPYVKHGPMQKILNKPGRTSLDKIATDRREGSLARLRAAADKVFAEQGYFSPTIDDIARVAHVSRPTFYRYFDTKFAAALDLFERESRAADPLWREIGKRDFTRREIVAAWILELFDFYAARRHILRTFIEMGTAEPSFLTHLMRIVPVIISDLGDYIPSFAAARGGDEDAIRQWTRACLLLQQLIDQCAGAAMGFLLVERDLLIEILAESLHSFMNPAESTR